MSAATPEAPSLSAAAGAELKRTLGRRPLVLLSLACILGLVWADAVTAPSGILLVLCLVAVSLNLFLVFRAPAAACRMLLLTVFILAALRMSLQITPPPAVRALARQRSFRSLEGLVRSVERNRIVLATQPQPGGRTILVSLTVPDQPALHVGDKVELGEVSLWLTPAAGTPGERDEARAFAREGIHLCGRAGRILSTQITQPLRVSFDEALVHLRVAMLRLLTRAMPGPEPEVYAPLLAGMVYGMKVAPIAPDIVEAFRRCGTIHVLVASGSQVSIIALSLIFLVRGTRRTLPLWGLVLVTVGLVSFSALAGMGVSINRAVAMGSLLLGTFAWGRQYDLLTALAVSGLALSLLSPGMLFTAGAQLTFACTLGVYLAAPEAGGCFARRLFLWIARGTFGAWLLASPVLISHFHSLVLLGTIANLLIVPLSAIILYLGLLAIGLGFIWLPLAVPLCWVARLLLEWMVQITFLCASLPLATIAQFSLPLLGLILWYAVAGAVLGLMRQPALRARAARLPAAQYVPVAVAVLGVVMLLWSLQAPSPQSLQMVVMDVGAGQCVLVRGSSGTVVIDAGSTPLAGRDRTLMRRRVLPFLAVQHIRRLDAIIVTHPHEDHCSFVDDLMRAVPTGQLFVGPTDNVCDSWLQMQTAARQLHVPVRTLQQGGALTLGPETRLEVLEAEAFLDDRNDANDESVILRLRHGQTAVLLPGDAEARGEQRLLDDYASRPELLRAQAMLAGHHGSRTSNSAKLLRAVQPRLVVISCGRARYGPAQEVLGRLRACGAETLRTDYLGTIILTSDGKALRATGYRRRR